MENCANLICPAPAIHSSGWGNESNLMCPALGTMFNETGSRIHLSRSPLEPISNEGVARRLSNWALEGIQQASSWCYPLSKPFFDVLNCQYYCSGSRLALLNSAVGLATEDVTTLKVLKAACLAPSQAGTAFGLPISGGRAACLLCCGAVKWWEG